MRPCSEAGKPCNPCVDAAKACYLNETCRRLRSAYNIICSKVTPPQSSAANQEPCSRKRCQKTDGRAFCCGDTAPVVGVLEDDSSHTGSWLDGSPAESDRDPDTST
ncbi:hypothetical protein CHARACLAT_021351 [Characodon lateralis]|uniref:Uncharacterized protein n=1 Tax=Characodon lateralis TaxID=208331 RepID=A0ABU7DIP4_9TELE|nr:hypothetical protein [Characodon lateralis]